MKKAISLVAVAGASALILAGCSGGSGDGGFLPCIVSDAGGFTDKSFNQTSYEGLVRAADELGIEFRQAESGGEADFGPNLDNMVNEGCTLIVSVGFALSAATVASALDNPDIDYLLVDDAADNDFDGTTDAPNIKPLLYDTAQAAYLAGYLAAGYSPAGSVGTFGGMPFPTVTIFMDGFMQGVNAYNEENSANVSFVGFQGGDQGVFTGGFEDNDEATGAAQTVIDQGVDVIMPVGGPIFLSALTVMNDTPRDIAMIGVDTDFFISAPETADVVLTSVMKNMNQSVYDNVIAASSGEFDATAYVGTLENGGVEIAPLHNFESKVDTALVDRVEAIKQEIIDGARTVTSYLN
jgi:basic membrane protein A